jgi:hypothetical protein
MGEGFVFTLSPRQIMLRSPEGFGQRVALTSSQLYEHHCRYEKIKTLCQELDRMGTKQVVERLKMAS